MNDAIFRLRVPTGEIRLWKEEARMRKMSVSAWVRMRCRSFSTGMVVDIAKEGQCEHHKMKGELCYKCDGQFGMPKVAER